MIWFPAAGSTPIPATLLDGRAMPVPTGWIMDRFHMPKRRTIRRGLGTQMYCHEQRHGPLFVPLFRQLPLVWSLRSAQIDTVDRRNSPPTRSQGRPWLAQSASASVAEVQPVIVVGNERPNTRRPLAPSEPVVDQRASDAGSGWNIWQVIFGKPQQKRLW